MIRRVSVTVALLALLLAACGDDDAAEEGSDTTESTSETTPAGGGDGDDEGSGGDAAGTTVTIVDFAFDPPTIEVDAGSTVTWTNDDGVTHTVTAGTPGSAEETFDESLDGGASAEVTFDDAGTFPYFCAIHTNMTGEVVVS